jgi:hypothetical protein
MKHAHEIEIGAHVGYLHKTSGTLARGPLVKRGGKYAVLNMMDKTVADMIVYAIMHGESISSGAIPLVIIEDPENDRMDDSLST